MVTSQPANTTVAITQSASFTAAATGTPAPTVQWQFEVSGSTFWADIPGATSTTYSFTPTGADSGTFYRAAFTNGAGTVTTSAAELTVGTTGYQHPISFNQALTVGTDPIGGGYSVPVTLTGQDPNNHPLTYSVISGPTYGTLSGTAPNLTYYPPPFPPNGAVTDSFAFEASNAAFAGNVATVTLNVVSPPTPIDQHAATLEDTPVAITLTATSPGNLPLTDTVTNGPFDGTVSGTAPNLTYTPDAGFVGTDSFSYEPNDGYNNTLDSMCAVFIHVGGVPTANSQTVTVISTAPEAVTLGGSDPTGLSLTYAIVTQPNFGTLSGTAPDLTYTPSADFPGADSFAFTVSNSYATSAPASVTITQDPVPQAIAQTVVTSEPTTLVNGTVEFDLQGASSVGNPLTYELTTQPADGTLSMSGNLATYTPNAGFSGSDSFQFIVNDGYQNSAPATETVIVNSPVAAASPAQTLIAYENQETSFTLGGSNQSGGSTTYKILYQPANGTIVAGNTANVTYIPNPGFSGTDFFLYEVGSNGSFSAPITQSIDVHGLPTALDDLKTVGFGETVTEQLEGYDPSGDPLQYNVLESPPGFTYLGNGEFTYTAPSVASWVASGNFAQVTPGVEFNVSDGHNTSAPARFGLGVDLDTGGSTVENLLQEILDGEIGDALELESVAIGDGTIPDSPFNGGINVVENTPTPITLQSYDPLNKEDYYFINGSFEGPPYLQAPSHGTLSFVSVPDSLSSLYPPYLLYTPDPGYVGNDSFTYGAVSNDEGPDLFGIYPLGPTATVNINVTPPPSGGPVATNQNFVVNEGGGPTSITLISSDPNNDPLNFVVSLPPAEGTLTGTAPILQYTPPANNPASFGGIETLAYYVIDETTNQSSDIGVVTFDVDGMSAASQTVTVAQGADTPFALTAEDLLPGFNDVSFQITSYPEHGIVEAPPAEGLSSQPVVYYPVGDYTGTDSLTYTASDGVRTSQGTITFDVLGKPSASSQTLGVAPGSQVSFQLTGSDPNGLPLSFTEIGQPQYGTLSALSGSTAAFQ